MPNADQSELAAATQALTQQVERLTGVVEEVRDEQRAVKSALHSRSRLFAACFVVIVALLGAVVFSLHTSAKSAACVRGWANATTARTNILTPLSNARNKQLDRLIGEIPLDTPTQFHAGLLAYIQVSNAYENAVQTNPPPLAPKFTC